MLKNIFLVSLAFFPVCAFTQVQYDNTRANPHQIQFPYGRIIQPAGLQIFFGDDSLENHSLDAALSPDEQWLAVEERTSIVFISTIDNKVKYTLSNDDIPELKGGRNTYSGIIWHSGSGTPEIYWSAVGLNKKSFVVSAKWNGLKAVSNRRIEYKPEPGTLLSLPNEILITSEAGKEYLYVVLNGNNKVIKQDLLSGNTIWVTDTGVAPYGMTMASGKLYVTNWAGRHPESSDKEVAGVPWGLARVDDKAGGGTREGSITVVDPVNGRIIKELVAGLHPNEVISSGDGKFVYVTNSNSDNVSVINTSKDEITETISVRLQPGINPFFGDSPDGLCLSDNLKRLYVTNGMDNAVAVIKLGKKATDRSVRKESKVAGFIPTGGYPSAISQSRSDKLYVCNLEASGARLGLIDKNTNNLVYNSHHMLASVSVIPVPGKKALKMYTDTVVAVNNLSRAMAASERPRDSARPKPVPDRIGEPSVFKHVVYIIKENRTYDQVLGDMKQGDGDPTLCIYGADVTPNMHRLSEEFLLLDNYRVSGKCSAEGHQWTDASIVTDYIEKNMIAWFRSYPHVQTDALVYAPTGFLWDNAMNHGKKVRIYGEASVPVFKEKTTWSDVYYGFLKDSIPEFTNRTTIGPVKKILSESYPSFGNHEFPDIVRADAFIKELNAYSEMEGDQLPELMILALPNDHTGGTRPGLPTPRAMVADNDLALGQIVEALSRSRFWESTVIFITEDDSQNGWDHVSAYRTTGLVVSPYSRLKNTNHTYYTQPSMVRTIEQILGLTPMNIQDAIASTMTNCFNDEINLTPYEALPNNIPLNEMNPQLDALTGKALDLARKSLMPEFDGIDSGNDELLNRILWYASKANIPYPVKFEGSNQEEDN